MSRDEEEEEVVTVPGKRSEASTGKAQRVRKSRQSSRRWNRRRKKRTNAKKASASCKEEEEEAGDDEEEETLPGVKRAKGKVKSGGVVLGPGKELVFYASKRGSHVVDCPVFGKDHYEYFETKTLVPCDVGSLQESHLDWACRLRVVC
jgi:hypothetical protein